MKRVILLMVVVCLGFFVVGCAEKDKAYGKAKNIYERGKEAYKVLPVKSKKLEAVNKAAAKYDEIRTIVRDK